jgi:hypothetical protein
MDNTTEEPRLEIDGNAIAAACGDFARLYLAHESQLGITYRFDQVLGKFARLGDDVNILLSIIVNDDARSTQEASIKNLRTSMKTLEKALVQWNATAPKTLPSSDSANAPVQSETAAGWKGTALRHLHNARSGRIDSGGTAPKLSDQWTSEVQRILSNDKRGLSDMDKRIQRYGIQTITEPHKIRVLFMRYFGTIHRHRLAAHQRRFANPPPDPALKNIHDLFIQYLDRSEQLLNAYHDAQRLIVAGGLQHKPLEIASVQKNMGDRQQEWARSLTTLNTVMSDLFDPQSK